jgi:hypothetical protein
MPLWQPASVLSRVHSDTTRHQTWRSKTESYKKCQGAEQCEIHFLFCGGVQLLRNYIQNFEITAAHIFKLTHQDSGYLSGPLQKPAQGAFQTLQRQLGQEPTLAFPQANQEYLLITNAYTPTTELLGGLCATLAQKDEKGKTCIILTHPEN